MLAVVDSSRFTRAIAAIDAANADDPNTLTVGGLTHPKVHKHAEMVSEWVRRLRPEAAEALLLAARAHHIRRWTIPRNSYPEGRQGYLEWRRRLHEYHAAELRQILEREGYEEATIGRAEAIVRKSNLWTDPDVQALEDALCLVFLETEVAELAAKLDEAKMVEVLRKTLRKMTERGKEAALGLTLSVGQQALLEKAIGEVTGTKQ
jgi:hypothetical protein